MNGGKKAGCHADRETAHGPHIDVHLTGFGFNIVL
jgi:hypothetical protein